MRAHVLADKATLSDVRKEIRAELSSIGAPSGPAFDCLVAVTEACTNAIVHGNGDTSSQPPEISWSVEPGIARFWIVDYSNKEGVQRASAEEEDDPRAGGYGLPMMRKLMDNVDVHFSPHGTTVSLEKSFEPD